jgi:hypothetical protein
MMFSVIILTVIMTTVFAGDEKTEFGTLLWSFILPPHLYGCQRNSHLVSKMTKVIEDIELRRRHAIQHNDTQLNDIQVNECWNAVCGKKTLVGNIEMVV